MIYRTLFAVLAGTNLITLGAGDALAQALPPRGETVESRPRPEIDPLGVRVRSFLFFPKLEVEEEYNDNIFATENDREDDFITRIIPSLNIQSDWSRHFLQFETGADSAFHAHNQNEDYTDYFFESDGRIDFARESALSLGGGYARVTEPRTDPDAEQGRNPTEIDRYRAFAAYEQGFGLFGASVAGEFLRLDFSDDGTSDFALSPPAPPGTPLVINNDDRDRNVYEGEVRLSYEVLPPDYDAFVQFGGNNRDYDKTPDDQGFDRDSVGWNVETGVELDLGGLVFGEGFVGYFDQSYDDDDLDDISGFTYGLEFDWNVTPLTTVSLFGAREVRETTQTEVRNGVLRAASGALRSSAGFTIDHELLRSLILSTGFLYFNNDFEGIDREDDNYTFELGARYFLNRYLYFNANYGFARRSSNTDGDGTATSDDFTQNIFSISVEAQL